jgi:hypothetical protein
LEERERKRKEEKERRIREEREEEERIKRQKEIERKRIEEEQKRLKEREVTESHYSVMAHFKNNTTLSVAAGKLAHYNEKAYNRFVKFLPRVYWTKMFHVHRISHKIILTKWQINDSNLYIRY